MEQEFYERINLNTKLENISQALCEKMALGRHVSDELILVGYEDFNYIMTTDTGKYCVKIFNKNRSDEDVKKYIDRIELAQTLDINTPKVITTDNIMQSISYDGTTYRLLVFEYIDGKSFYDLGEIPDENETKEIIRQMATLHKAELKSEFIYDKWAIINFVKEYDEKKASLDGEYIDTFGKLAEKFKKLNWTSCRMGLCMATLLAPMS